MQTAAPATSFASWATANGVIASNAEDTDNDGINNLLEYALDLNPNAAETSLPSVALENDAGTDYLTLTFRRSLDAPDLTYTVESSADLSSWSTATLESTTVTNADVDGDGSAELVKVRVDITGQPKQFVRLKVSQ